MCWLQSHGKLNTERKLEHPSSLGSTKLSKLKPPSSILKSDTVFIPDLISFDDQPNMSLNLNNTKIKSDFPQILNSNVPGEGLGPVLQTILILKSKKNLPEPK